MPSSFLQIYQSDWLLVPWEVVGEQVERPRVLYCRQSLQMESGRRQKKLSLIYRECAAEWHGSVMGKPSYPDKSHEVQL